MPVQIENPADCEVWHIIRFLQAENFTLCDIHCRFVSTYGEGVKNAASVRKWYILFRNGRIHIHDEERWWWPSVITDALKQKVDFIIRENRRFTISEVHGQYQEVSRSTVHEIVAQHLEYHKICARWVPRILTDDHKAWRMCATLAFLEVTNGMNSAHSPTFSVTSPTSQLILQPFSRFTYVTAYSPTLPLLHLRHWLFTYVTWRVAHELMLPISM